MPSAAAAKAVLAGLVTVVALAALASGLAIIDMPWTARDRRLDARRVLDLTQIAEAVDRFWTQRRTLPDSIADVAGAATVGFIGVDPNTSASPPTVSNSAPPSPSPIRPAPTTIKPAATTRAAGSTLPPASASPCIRA